MSQTGNNELACTSGTNCTGGHMKNYAAGTGYDAASGLGSFDINSFVSNYAPLGTKTSTVTLTIVDPATNKAPVVWRLTPNCTTHSSWLKFTVTARPAAAVPQQAMLSSLSQAPSRLSSRSETLTLAGGTANNTWNLLPGGTYNIYARYTGDGTYLPSVGAGNPSTITVKPEACQMVAYAHNINTGSTTSIPYGTPITITVEPYSAATTNNVGIPSGSINVTDSSTLITTLPVNSEGAATFSSNLLAQGSPLDHTYLPRRCQLYVMPDRPILTWPTSPRLQQPQSSTRLSSILATAEARRRWASRQS